MAMQRLTLVLIVIGISLVLLSHLWKDMSASASRWTEEDAEQTTAATMRLHKLTHLHGHKQQDGHEEEPAPEPEELKEARKQFDLQQEKLAEAKKQGDSIVLYVRWSGIALVCLGAAVYLINKNRFAENSPASK